MLGRTRVTLRPMASKLELREFKKLQAHQNVSLKNLCLDEKKKLMYF